MTWLDLTITLLHELVNLQLQDVLMSALILECCVGLGFFFLFVSGLGLVGFFFFQISATDLILLLKLNQIAILIYLLMPIS